ncbi:hypothetical protein BYT27DRAFT_7188810 [Phlegmacium glaucopus]|nr:hypothetical protein BYT27DRAFT_7188810 [Phlegmacium glaucopus]
MNPSPYRLPGTYFPICKSYPSSLYGECYLCRRGLTRFLQWIRRLKSDSIVDINDTVVEG